MGLHQKTRDYLFQEFVRRNYRGASSELQKLLLELRPDELIHMKQELERHASRFERLLQFLRAHQPGVKGMEAHALELLRTASGAGRSALYSLDRTLTGRLCARAGSSSKLPARIRLDRELLPHAVPHANLAELPSSSPLSAELKRQGLAGSACLLLRRGTPSALCTWNSPQSASDSYLALILELLALLRGDRALPVHTHPTPPSKKRKAPSKPPEKKGSRTKPAPAHKARLIPPGTLREEPSPQPGPELGTRPLPGSPPKEG